MFFLVKYCKTLEEGSFRGRSSDFLWMLLLGKLIDFGAQQPFITLCFYLNCLQYGGGAEASNVMQNGLCRCDSPELRGCICWCSLSGQLAQFHDGKLFLETIWDLQIAWRRCWTSGPLFLYIRVAAVIVLLLLSPLITQRGALESALSCRYMCGVDEIPTSRWVSWVFSISQPLTFLGYCLDFLFCCEAVQLQISWGWV